jgi:DNA-directed RNA polymerase subunit RPC12/RpoP
VTKTKKRKPEPEPQWVACPECGEEQMDMGRGVRCDACGYGPMPFADGTPEPEGPAGRSAQPHD